MNRVAHGNGSTSTSLFSLLMIFHALANVLRYMWIICRGSSQSSNNYIIPDHPKVCMYRGIEVLLLKTYRDAFLFTF